MAKVLSSVEMPTPDCDQNLAGRLDALYRNHWCDLVRYIAHRFDVRPSEPEDIAQSAFAKLAETRSTVAIADHRAYLFTMAHNLALDVRRQVGRRDAIHRDTPQFHASDRSQEPSSERIMISRERVALLERAVERMPAMRRRIFLLVRVEGLTVRDVARRFGMREDAVHKHVSRALHDCVAQMGQDE